MSDPATQSMLLPLKCASCGAGVSVPSNATRVRCDYCSASVKVKVKGAGNDLHTVVPSKAGLYVLAAFVPVLIGLFVLIAGRGDASYPELKPENVHAARVEGAGVRLQATIRVVRDVDDARPVVNVEAACGEHRESQRMLDGELQGLEASSSRTGTVTFFGTKTLAAAQVCEFVLSFEGTQTMRDFKYCLRPDGEVWRSACK